MPVELHPVTCSGVSEDWLGKGRAWREVAGGGFPAVRGNPNFFFYINAFQKIKKSTKSNGSKSMNAKCENLLNMNKKSQSQLVHNRLNDHNNPYGK
jgi:hypothetical protein